MRKLLSKLLAEGRIRAASIDILVGKHLPEVLDAICRDRHHDVISHVNAFSGGQFKYVGNGKVKVIIGAGPQQSPGWLSTDISFLNIVNEASWRNLFNVNTIDNLLAEHVLEHLSLDEFGRVLDHVRTYLKHGGIFRIAVPDAFHPSRYYYNLVKPGGWETPDQHKVFFDYEMMRRIAEGHGYTVRLLEYFDEHGKFHKAKFSEDDGAIQRCADNNCGLDTSNEKVMEKFYATISNDLRQQFYDQKMTYTSLIVDLIK